MRILKIVHGFPPECRGGTESYVVALAHELVSEGHKVEVVTGSHEARPRVTVERYEHEGLVVHKLHRSGLFVDDWDKSFAPEVEAGLDPVLAAFRPDLVHVHHWIRLSRHLIGFLHERGVPAVCTLHDLWTTCPMAFRIRGFSFCERPPGATSCHDCAPHGERADDVENAEALELFREDFRNELHLARRVIVPSRAHKDVVLRHHPAIAGKIRVVPHGAISRLRPRAGRDASPDGRIRIGHWGHLSKLKGIDILLEAVASLPRRLRDRIDVSVFGTIVYPGERAGIEALAREAGVTLRGDFTPAMLEAQPLDLAVIPTRCSESHSFVLDEAFLLGLPAIVPGRGALADRIGRAGRTFAPEDPKDLARRLAEVIEDPGILKAWRAAIPKLRAFALHTRDILGVYHEVLSSHAPLLLTPPELQARRARFRSLQVAARNRGMEFLTGDRDNLAADVARAQATMDEMQRHHVEKDAVIEAFGARLAESRAEKDAELDALRMRLAESEVAGARATTDAERRLVQKDAELDALRARLAESDAACEHVIAELGKAQLAMNDHLRVAANDERVRVTAELQGAMLERIRAAEEAWAAEVRRRDALLDEAARALDAATSRPAPERPASRAPTAAAPAAPAPTSILDRLKRKAFGDDGAHAPRLAILYVVHQFLPRHVAGTEICTLNLARSMRQRGHRVAILTCESDHSRAPFEYTRKEYDGLPVHEVIHNYRWDSFQQTYDSPRADAIFERVLDAEAPDVVHVEHLHYLSANFLAIARRRGIPIVYTLHDYSILCPRDGQMRREDGVICEDAIPDKCADCIGTFSLEHGHVPARLRNVGVPVSTDLVNVMRRVHAGLPPLEDRQVSEEVRTREDYVEAAAERLNAWRHAIRDVDLFVSPSRFLRDLFVRTGMIPAGRIIVSPNGQDVARFANMPRRVRGDALRFGYAGTIAEHKGVHVLVEAMNALRDQPAAECRIWGETNAFVEYTERLRALNSNPRTQLMGPFRNEDVARVFSEIDVLVIPSLWYENAPMTIQEAALARLPVIASNIGGLAEHVIEGRNGLPFHVGDAGDLRNKLVWFLEDFSRCDRFDFAAVPITSIEEEAERMERRYLELARPESVSSARSAP